MQFGKRLSVDDNRRTAAIKHTCERCRGSGFVRERGSRILCKPCNGIGKVEASADLSVAKSRL
jgi:DnaJ-class molecular chaperone